MMRDWYLNLAERERRFVIGGAIALLLALIVGTVLPLNRNIAQARQRINIKTADLAYIQSAVPQLASAGPLGGGASPESLVVLVDTSARESGLGKALTNSQPTGDGALRVRLERAAFDGMVAWLARLSQQHGVRVESAEIESAGETGLVNAGLVLKAG